MARRSSDNRLDHAINLWAIWCFRGGFSSAGQTTLANWMDSKGELTFGSSGPRRGPADDLELGIEGCVLRMATESLIRADVLRLEYGVGTWEVTHRRGIRGYDMEHSTQIDKALALGISYRTYCRHLAAARSDIEKQVLKA